MIDFHTVTREMRSLINRRKYLMTFLGALFAATSLFLHNVLKGNLPREFEGIKPYIFSFYAVMVMVPCSILALRLAKLHGGMMLNGVLYARLMQEQDFTRRGDPQRSARHNFLGVAFLQFLLLDLFAGASATLLVLSLNAHLSLSLLAGGAVFLAWLLMYVRFHRQAVALAFQMIAEQGCGSFGRKDWQEHVSTSREDANTGMLSDIAFVGLIMFSVFEKLTGLGEIKPENAGAAYDDLKLHGPWVYSLLMLLTCVFGLFVYVRVRIAVGSFSLQLDPSDQPFRPLRLTDSLLGYLLLAFLFVVALHMVLILLVPRELPHLVMFAIDAVALVTVVVLEQAALWLAGRRYRAG